ASVAMRAGMAPYRGVLTHGFTVDAKGRKMSKSLGNVIEPQQIMKTLGADVIRLWVAATDYRGEINVSTEILTRIAEAYRRLRNTARFLLANLHDFDPATDCVPAEKMLALDRWIVDRAWLLQQEITKAYDDYLFHVIYQKLHQFCTVEMGSLYLDIIKDRQYTCQTQSLARRSAQTALYHIAEALVRWFAPILSFTADEIWQHLPGKRSESVQLETWYPGLFPLTQNSENLKNLRHLWDTVLEVREAVSKELEKLRVANTIGSSLDAEVDIFCESDLYQQLIAFGKELRFIFITSAAQVQLTEAKSAQAVAHGNFWVEARPSAHPKCVRCWHHCADVGQQPEHPELCGRCVENVQGHGELRHYA
ncbi:MAG: isoleucine--tRNA ligase, partial [Beggiatoa sp. IS2]